MRRTDPAPAPEAAPSPASAPSPAGKGLKRPILFWAFVAIGVSRILVTAFSLPFLELGARAREKIGAVRNGLRRERADDIETMPVQGTTETRAASRTPPARARPTARSPHAASRANARWRSRT